MAVECTINVGFHSNFGRFRQSGHSKTPLRLVIINEFRSTQPTTPKKLSQTQPDLLFVRQIIRCVSPDALPLSLDPHLRFCYHLRHRFRQGCYGSQGISIALTKGSLWDFYRRIGYRAGISIAFAVHSVDRSLDPAGALKGWWAVPTLQTVFFKQAINQD